jgi:molybdopterin/thiamine biosynthesis adenylyltransferase
VGSREGHRSEVEDLVEAADLIVDATGDQGVTRLLHDRSADKGKKLMILNLTRGAYGARILVLRGSSPCLDCFFGLLDSGSVQDAPEGPELVGTTPIGCSHPAASGAGFDAAECVAVAARKAIQELGTTTYPADESDWILLSFRDADQTERFRSGKLPIDPNCPFCGGES